MAYAIVISPRARREAAKLPSNIAERIYRGIDALAYNPRPPGCKKLTGLEAWRIRVGDYRVIHEIQDARLVVLVLPIGHRRDVCD